MPVVGIPHASHALIQTLDRLRHLLELLAVGGLQDKSLLENGVWLHVPHADRFLPSVDVLAFDAWVLARTRRDGDLDTRVLARKFRKHRFEERAVLCVSFRSRSTMNTCSKWTYFMPRLLPAQSQ